MNHNPFCRVSCSSQLQPRVDWIVHSELQFFSEGEEMKKLQVIFQDAFQFKVIFVFSVDLKKTAPSSSSSTCRTVWEEVSGFLPDLRALHTDDQDAKSHC